VIKRLALVLAGCSANHAAPIDAALDATATDAAPGDALVSLDPTSGIYRQTCDGSAGVALDFAHFLNFDDEDQRVGLYTRAAAGDPVQSIDVSTAIGMTTGDEADLEDAARLGDRVYVIGSHGRDDNGTLQPTRSRLFAIDLAGAPPAVTLTVAGFTANLLVDLLDAANWQTPDAGVIAALVASSKLGDMTDASLAPKDQGTNIEGLGVLPGGRLAIGFRNPQPANQALIVTLLNPDAVIAGATAQFGEAIELPLGGLAIRGLAWSEVHGEMLVLAGPHDTGGPFQLFTWSGAAGDAPALVDGNLLVPTGSSAEAVIPYAGTRDVQILFDMGESTIGTSSCKKAAVAAQQFDDVIIHVD
jgi:hypothetical protein